MDHRRKEIEAIEEEIGRVELQIHAELLALGKQVAAADRASIHHSELAKYLASVDTLKKSIETYRADIARIREDARHAEILTKEAVAAEARVHDLTAERDSRLADLGAGCWTVYKALADKEPYRSLFEEVAKHDLEAEGIAKDLKAIEDEERHGLFDKLRAYGKKLARRGAFAKAEKKKADALAAAGTKLAASDFSRHASGDLRLVFDFIQEKTRAIASFTGDATARRAQIATLHAGLQKLGIEGEVEPRVRDLERRIGDLQRELDVMLGWAGQLFFERDLRRELVDAALGAKWEVVNGIRSTIARKREAIGRLRAEGELEDLGRKDKALRAKRQQLDDERKVRERQIAVVDLELGAGEKRMDELRRVLAGEAPFTPPAPLPSPDFYEKAATPPPSRPPP